MKFELKNFKREFTVKRLANVQYFEFTAGYKTAFDKHAFHELIYIDNGEISIFSQNFNGKLSKQEMIIHPAGTKHRFEVDKSSAPNVIIIGFESTDVNLLPLTESPIKLNEELKNMLAKIVVEGQNVFLPPYDIPNLKNMPKKEDFEFGADQIIQNLLEIFIIMCLRKKSQSIQADGLSKTNNSMPIKDYVDNNFTKGISTDSLCTVFNTNRTTLAKNLKAQTGMGLSKYINKLRIEYTKTLLREQKYTLTQIADILNISSVHYLTSLFTKHEKMSPTVYLSTIKSKMK